MFHSGFDVLQGFGFGLVFFKVGGTDFHDIAKTNAEEGQLIAGNFCSLCLSELPTYAFFFFFGGMK